MSPDLLACFAEIVGAKNALTEPADIAPYLAEPRDLFHGRAAMVLRPGTTTEVAAILKLATETGTPIVPQGGNTGLVGGQIPDMVSIHVRPPEIEDRVIPGHWEGDLIKGKANASAVGTLVERSSGYLMLVKMHDATATSAVEGFSAALNRMPLAARKSMTYDQGREMARHAEITRQTGVAIYFCDPHSPWQRGSNENINGLIRQYLPKGTDLSPYSQEQLDAIAYELNIRPRKRFDFKCPIEVMTELMAKYHEPSLSLH